MIVASFFFLHQSIASLVLGNEKDWSCILNVDEGKLYSNKIKAFVLWMAKSLKKKKKSDDGLKHQLCHQCVHLADKLCSKVKRPVAKPQKDHRGNGAQMVAIGFRPSASLPTALN